MDALTPLCLRELRDAIDRSLQDGARCRLLRGEGRGFSSGADLSNGEGSLPEDLGQLLAENHNPPPVRQIASLPIPFITVVQGAAAGAGCSLALLGGLVVGSRSAYFLLAFANVGLVPDAGFTWLMVHSIGRGKALEMMLLGERVPAEQAERWGLIHKAVDDVALAAEAAALARRLAGGPTTALGLMRRAVFKAASTALEADLEREADDQRRAGGTDDFREALTAFAQKRRAAFSAASATHALLTLNPKRQAGDQQEHQS